MIVKKEAEALTLEAKNRQFQEDYNSFRKVIEKDIDTLIRAAANNGKAQAYLTISHASYTFNTLANISNLIRDFYSMAGYQVSTHSSGMVLEVIISW